MQQHKYISYPIKNKIIFKVIEGFTNTRKEMHIISPQSIQSNHNSPLQEKNCFSCQFQCNYIKPTFQYPYSPHIVYPKSDSPQRNVRHNYSQYRHILHHIQPLKLYRKHINAHELLSSYLRYEAASLCQTNDVCTWMHMNSCLHTQGMKLHRYAQ